MEIQITDENSRPIEGVTAMVEIGGLGSGQQRTYTNTDGRAMFSVRSGMTYQITVSGAEFETATANFELLPEEMMHRESTAVKLKETGNRNHGGIVSASNLNVPQKARDEFAKGMSEMDKSKWDSAKKHFEKAIGAYPKYDWAYNNLGVVEMQLKNPAAASEAFSKAFEINDKNPDAAANMAQMKLGDNDYKGAEELLRKSLIVQPQNSKALMLLAFAQFRAKEFPAALANAEKVHQGDIDHYPIAHLIAARIREGMGDQAGAEHQYQAYLKEAPEGPEAASAKEGLMRLEAKR